MKKSKKAQKSIDWSSAPDVKKRAIFLTRKLKLDWVKTSQITFFKSSNANTRAYARIWGLGRIWQQALKIPAHYILEVISEKYDRLDEHQKNEVILHELTHIPRNFSGSLMPHVRHGKGRFGDRLRRLLYEYSNHTRG